MVVDVNEDQAECDDQDDGCQDGPVVDDELRLPRPQPAHSFSFWATICAAGYTDGMSTENSHEEDTNEPEPHGMIGKDGELWFRDVDGGWHKHERVSTGDPEKDRILEKPIPEVEEILADPEHPLHDKAAEVSTELAQRIAASIRPWGLVHPETRKQFFGVLSASTTAEWFLRLTEESRRGFAQGFEMMLPVYLARGWDFSSSREDPHSEVESVKDDFTESDEDDSVGVEEALGGVEPFVAPAPDAPTVVQVEWAEASARRFDAMIGTLEQTRIDNNRSADEANDLAADANKIARTGRLIAWIALGVSVVAAVITVLQ